MKKEITVTIVNKPSLETITNLNKRLAKGIFDKYGYEFCKQMVSQYQDK